MGSGSVGTVATHGVTTSSPCTSDCVQARVAAKSWSKSLDVLLSCHYSFVSKSVVYSVTVGSNSIECYFHDNVHSHATQHSTQLNRVIGLAYCSYLQNLTTSMWSCLAASVP